VLPAWPDSSSATHAPIPGLVDVTLKLWHVAVVALGAVTVVAFMAGRYVMPVHKTATKTQTVYIRLGNDQAAENRLAAQADVRAAVPGMEAYNADHATGYAGVTMTKLQASYDAGINADANARIVKADAVGYCIESTVGSATYHKSGPVGDILSGPCP
jgi:anti-sigma-K factor RskA